MRKLRALLIRLAGWKGREDRERELREELNAHFQMHLEDNLRAGMSAAEARRQAALRFGSVDAATESMRAGWTVAFLETARQDLVYALRGLRRNPVFALTATLSLALGIGASIAIFTVADSLLLRPLPYRDAAQLMMVWETNPTHRNSEHNVVSPGNYRDWKTQNSVFAELAAFEYDRASLSDGRRAEEVAAQAVTADLFPMLGVQPFLGRVFTAAEDRPGAPRVLLISYRLWQSWFGGDEGIVGRQVQWARRPATVIGVLPPEFYLRDREADAWEPLQLDSARDYRKKSGRYLMSLGRLKPGATRAAAQTQMTAIAKRLEADYPVFDKNWTITVEPLRDSLVRTFKTSILVLLGAVTLLLAVACVNVANLLLARHTARRREMAVRVAIGAGRWRVVRQLMSESLILAITGGALGLLIAGGAVKGLLALAPRDLVQNASIAVDARIVFFAIALSLATGMVFGLVPALVVTGTDLAGGMREGSRGGIGGHGRLRNWLVAAEVALSVMLLAGAGLLVRSLIRLEGVDPGLDPSRVLTFRVIIPEAKYQAPFERIQFFTRALEGMRAIPGIGSASAISYLPFYWMSPGTYVDIGGRPPAKPGEELLTHVRTVLPEYFRTMGIPIKSGRDFTPGDNAPETPYRFIVNESFARSYFGGENPLGKQISVRMQRTNPFGEIVGVVGDVKEGSVDQPPAPTAYYIFGHMPATMMTFVLRAGRDPRSLAEPARRVIHALDPEQPVASVETMRNIVRETFSRQRFSAILLTGFSLVALLLASVGIYGVLAYTVTGRTREFGVRVALGAEPGRIVALVLGTGARLILSGAVAGIVGAMALTGLLKSMLFGVGTHDAATFAVVPLVLAAVALLAAWLPARRASRLDPVAALRAD